VSKEETFLEASSKNQMYAIRAVKPVWYINTFIVIQLWPHYSHSIRKANWLQHKLLYQTSQSGTQPPPGYRSKSIVLAIVGRFPVHMGSFVAPAIYDIVCIVELFLVTCKSLGIICNCIAPC